MSNCHPDDPTRCQCGAVYLSEQDCISCDLDLELCEECGNKPWIDHCGGDALCEDCAYKYHHTCDECGKVFDFLIDDGNDWLRCFECFKKDLITDVTPIANSASEWSNEACDILFGLERLKEYKHYNHPTDE